MHLVEAVDGTDEELPRSRFVLCFDYNIPGGFLTDRMRGKRRLRSEEISTEEYRERKKPAEPRSTGPDERLA